MAEVGRLTVRINPMMDLVSRQELQMIDSLLSDRIAELSGKHIGIDRAKYLELKALKGKIEGFINLQEWEAE